MDFFQFSREAEGRHRLEIRKTKGRGLERIISYDIINPSGRHSFSEKFQGINAGKLRIPKEYALLFKIIGLGRNANIVYVDQSFYSMKGFDPLYSFLPTRSKAFNELDKILVTYKKEDIKASLTGEVMQEAFARMLSSKRAEKEGRRLARREIKMNEIYEILERALEIPRPIEEELVYRPLVVVPEIPKKINYFAGIPRFIESAKTLASSFYSKIVSFAKPEIQSPAVIFLPSYKTEREEKHIDVLA